MLRILPEARAAGDENAVSLRLVGQLRGLWVAELRRIALDILESVGALRIDVAEVSFTDLEGLHLLQELAARRVSLVNCSLFLAEQLKAVEQDA